MKVNGQPVTGSIPLLVVTFEMTSYGTISRQPLEANINSMIDPLVFDYLTFPSLNGFYLENSQGLFSWRRADVIGPVKLDANESAAVDAQKSADFGDGVIRTGLDCGAGIAYLLGLVAAKTGYNFGQWDADHNGQITQDELSIMIVGNNGETSGANRPIGAQSSGFQVPGQNVTLSGKVAALDHHASFLTFTHELSHSLGTLDLYNTSCWDDGLSLMTCTIFANSDDRRTWHLDPWHKMLLGWQRPRLYLLGPGGTATVSVPQYQSPNTPIILYDAVRDTSEYFIVEFRNNQVSGGSGYDRDLTNPSRPTAAAGMVIWHVGGCPPGQTKSCPAVWTEGAPNRTPGGNALWNQATPLLTWDDGTATITRLNPISISKNGHDLTFEWVSDTQIWVDFNYGGFPFEVGSFTWPYNTLQEGIDNSSWGGTIIVKTGSSPESLTISNNLTITTLNGPVTIGR
jgi:M6 family metalloprotease-like protein